MTADRRPVRDQRGGFLLVEVLAVLAISAAILAGLASLTRLLMTQADTLAARTERFESRERGLAALSRDIRALARIRWEGPNRERFVFAGTPDRLLFAQERPGMGAPVAVLLQSAIEHGRVRLLRAEAPLPPGLASFDDLRFGPVRVLMDAPSGKGAERIRFAYVAGATERSPELILDAWPAEAPPPVAIRVGLADPATAEVMTSLRVPVLAEAEPVCAVAKTHWCSLTDIDAAEDTPGEAVPQPRSSKEPE